MGEEQLYNPVEGINQMIADIESVVTPMVFKFHPLLRILSILNIYLVVACFVAMLVYLVVKRKHRIGNKLKTPTNYFMAVFFLLLYVLLTETPIRLGPDISLNFGLVVMPMAAKAFGPLLAGAFGIVQYGASFAMHSGEAFSISSLLVAGLSGMIYGRFIYARRTTYLRCLGAKLLVNVMCNIFLVPMVTTSVMSAELADAITQSVVSNVFLAPLQALIIYAALIIMKKAREALSEVSWGIARKND
ncbi:MAG: hypothetical protein IJW15_00905 [Clostridia bacterium]|nr:hypothetical protein [Clostridia bacterium]